MIEENAKPVGKGGLAQILPFTIFALAGILLLLVVMAGAFAAESISGDLNYTNTVLISIASISLLAGLSVFFRNGVLAGLGMLLIAGICIAWFFVNQSGSTPAASGPVTSAALCSSAPWVDNRRNFSVNNQDAATDFVATPLGDATTFYRFRVTESSGIRFEATGADPALSIVSETGVQLQENDDAVGRDARIFAALPEGTYCVGVRTVSGPGPHNVRIGLQDQEKLIPDPFDACLVEDLTELEFGASPARVNVGSTGAGFRVNVDDNVVLNGVSNNVDPVLTLFDFEGNQLLRDDDGGNGNNARILIEGQVDPGEYCLMAEALSNNSGRIAVSADEYNPALIREERILSGEEAPDMLDPRVNDLGVLDDEFTINVVNDGTRIENIWHRFEVEANVMVVIDLTSSGRGDPLLTVYNEAGISLGRDDDGGEGNNSRLSLPLSPGRYMIRASDLSNGSLAGQLTITQFQQQ